MSTARTIPSYNLQVTSGDRSNISICYYLHISYNATASTSEPNGDLGTSQQPRQIGVFSFVGHFVRIPLYKQLPQESQGKQTTPLSLKGARDILNDKCEMGVSAEKRKKKKLCCTSSGTYSIGYGLFQIFEILSQVT